MLENLLDIAKLEAGKMRYIFERHSLKDTIKHVISEMKAILEKRSIQIIFDQSGERWEAEFDYERIQQVLRNIFANALKFIPDKTNIEITKIEREFIPKMTKNYVRGIGLQIRDYGPGIPRKI